MALYSASGKGLATAAGTNVVSLRSPSTMRAKINEIGIFSEAATALDLAIFLTTALDTGGTAVVLQKDDSGEAAPNSTVATLPTGGTLAAVATRRARLPAAIGAAVIFTFPRQIIIAPSLSLVIRNDGASAGPAITWYVSLEE